MLLFVGKMVGLGDIIKTSLSIFFLNFTRCGNPVISFQEAREESLLYSKSLKIAFLAKLLESKKLTNAMFAF